MPERLPPKPATSAGQFDLFGRPKAPEQGGPAAPAQGPQGDPAQGPASAQKAPGRQVLTVTELVRQVKGVVDGRFPNVLVKGEVSNVRTPSSGHVYFTLKDADACLDAVIFRSDVRRLKFAVKNGLSLVARGRLSVYEASGRIELVCDLLEPLGAGALQVAFEQLKARLAAEGLFETARKRKLPYIPKRIAIVTSPSGAAVHDFLRVLHRRFPNLAVVVVPVRVQGDGAAQEIARGIHRAGRQPGVEVVVVARGGGSLEDLWSFNEEVVARALAACPVPTVSAVGHEVDVTIADFVADVRAPTPTAAAELIARERHELEADLAQRRARLQRAFRAQMDRRKATLDRAAARIADPRRLIGDRRLRVDKLEQRLSAALDAQVSAHARGLQKLRDRLQAQHPAERLHRLRREVDRLHHRLEALGRRLTETRRNRLDAQSARLEALGKRTLEAPRHRFEALAGRLEALGRRTLEAPRHRFESLVGRLDALSPLRVLARGYAVAFDEQGHALRSAAAVKPGDLVRVRLHEGQLDAQVTAVTPPPEE